MLRVLVCLALLALCSGQSRKCCMPPQWEGMQVVLGGIVVKNQGQLIQSFSRMFFDTPKQRLAIITNATVGEKPITVLNIFDFSEGVGYQVNLVTQKCIRMKVSGKMPPTCLPDEAIPQGSIYFGGGSKTLQTELFLLKIKQATLLAEVSITLVKDGKYCYPVSEGLYGNSAGQPFVESYGFVDITNGIKDPSIFTPPPSCHNSPLAGVGFRKGHTLFAIPAQPVL